MTVQYEHDTHAWALEQTELLRTGKLEKLDIEHLADEIESVAKRERRALINQLARLLMHLLKWEQQPENRTRSQRLTIEDAQHKTLRLLNENPSLKTMLPNLMQSAYADARRAAAIDTDQEPEAFPEQCLYTCEDAISYQPCRYITD